MLIQCARTGWRGRKNGVLPIARGLDPPHNSLRKPLGQAAAQALQALCHRPWGFLAWQEIVASPNQFDNGLDAEQPLDERFITRRRWEYSTGPSRRQLTRIDFQDHDQKDLLEFVDGLRSALMDK